MNDSLISGIPVEAWVEHVWNTSKKDLRLTEWNHKISPQHLDVYKNSRIGYLHYRSFMRMTMDIVLRYDEAMKKLNKEPVNFPCGIYFDTISGEDHVFTEDDHFRCKPDCYVTTHVGHAILQHRREVQRNISLRDDSVRLRWNHLTTAFEFKLGRSFLASRVGASVPRALVLSGIPDAQSDSAMLANRKYRGKRALTDSEFGEPNPKRQKGRSTARNVRTAQASDPLGNQGGRGDGPSMLSSSEYMDMAGDNNLVIDYCAEMLQQGLRRYATSVLIHDGKVQLWYLDRMGPICSQKFDPEERQDLFALVIIAIARADLKAFGFEPMIISPSPEPLLDYQWKGQMDDDQELFTRLEELYKTGPSHETPLLDWTKGTLRFNYAPSNLGLSLNPVPRPSIDETPASAPTPLPATITTDFNFSGPPIYSQAGVLGRGTVIYPLKAPKGIDGYDSEEELIAKFSWQPHERPEEDKTIRFIDSKIPTKWKAHVPNLKCSKTLAGANMDLPRSKLTEVARLHVSQQKVNGNQNFLDIHEAFVGDKIEERELRVLVMLRYIPLNQVKSLDEFKPVFKDVVKVHYVVFKKTNILHRDLSFANIMFTRRDDRVIGVLNDWDLAAPETRESGPTALHRRGTAAFMAKDLLKNPDGNVQHKYCHDLESFAWILIYCSFVLGFNGQQSKLIDQSSSAKEWLESTNWAAIKSSRTQFLDDFRSSAPLPCTPSMRELEAVWVKPVIKRMKNTFHERSNAEVKPGEILVEGDFFEFPTFMKVLEPEVDDPEGALGLDDV